MQPTKHDIAIRLRLGGEDTIHPKDLVSALDTLEVALYESDRRDIERAALKFSIPPVIIDACLERLRGFRNDRIVLATAEPGSIVIGGLVAGVAYYVLQKTLGEIPFEAFKSTQFRRSLVEYFSQLIDDKAIYITERLRAATRAKKHRIDVRLQLHEGETPATILVNSDGRPMKRHSVPSMGQQLRDEARTL